MERAGAALEPAVKPAALSSGSTTTLRRRLLVLTAVTIIPLLVFVTAVVGWTFYEYRKAAREGLQSTARALSLAVDEQIITWKAALTALATSPALDEHDYATFRRQAEVVTGRYGGWIALSLPSGQQVVNTSQPIDSDLPHSDPVGLPAAVMRDGQQHVSDLFFGPATQRPGIAVTVPSVRGGVVTYALHLGVLPEDIAGLLARKGLPGGWFAGLVDSNNRIIARAPYDERLVGKAVSEPYLRAVAGADHGPFEGHVLGDVDVYGSFERLTQAPWTLVLAAPNAELARAWQRLLMVLAAGGAVFFLAASALALALGGRIANPVNALAGAARAVVKGEALSAVPESRVHEIMELRNAVMALSRKQILLREANHRIKNSLQIVSSSLGLQSRSASREGTKADLREAQSHIQAIARLHERLYQTDQYEAIDAIELVRSICGDMAALSANRAVVQVCAEGTARLDSADAGPFALTVAELVTNAVKHASQSQGGGRVEVRCRAADDSEIVITVSDTGPGLPPGFDLAGQTGLGLRMCLALTRQIGGTLRAIPSGGGAVFELRVPAAIPKA